MITRADLRWFLGVTLKSLAFAALLGSLIGCVSSSAPVMRIDELVTDSMRTAAQLDARDEQLANMTLARDLAQQALEETEATTAQLTSTLLALQQRIDELEATTVSADGVKLWCHQYDDPIPQVGCEFVRDGRLTASERAIAR